MKFIRTYISDVKIELKKVTWLSKNEMLGSTTVVWVFAIREGGHTVGAGVVTEIVE